MKQKKIGTTLYVFSEDPYVITEDTDANIIYIQEEVIFDFAKINIPLISKMKPINYHIVCVKHPEWADYYNDFTVYVEQTTGGTVTAYPTSGDEGEEISISHLASEGYDFDSWNVVDEDGNEIEVNNGKFLMPASNVNVSAVFIKTYYNQYLTIESQADNNTISWESSNESYTQDIQYSTDKINWTTVTSTTSGATLATLNTGEKLYFKGALTGHSEASNYESFNSSGNFIVYGNIMSLTNGDNFVNATTLTNNYQLNSLFRVSKITNASNLILPATTLTDSCYTNMFKDCTSLIITPELPATTLTNYCYDNMFAGCTSLTTAPALPATTLTSYCYRSMFNGCTSLASAPALPATTLSERCYLYMFRGCTSLTTAPALPATTLTSYCYYGMFQYCTSLVTAPSLSATTLTYQCYGWMFEGCTSLTTAPALPATTLAQGCYNSMFSRCTSLTTAPALPATTLAPECYWSMFYGCTSLTTAPVLPATTLTKRCYSQMFDGCTSLNSITMLATNIGEEYINLSLWVNGVSATGTFTKSASMTTLPTGKNGIPSGWTVVDA